MAYNTNTPRAEYTASATQTVFPFLFKIFATSDIKVYQTLAGATPDDTADILVLTTDYTVTINGDAGGEVTLNTGAAVNDKITLARNLSVTRATEYQQNGDLLASTLNADQEYQTYLIADNESNDNRYIKIPDSVQNVSTSLPAPVSDAYIKWNATANAIENDTTIPDAVTTSAANAAAASASATQAELYEWEAEAERLTADSYATEAEDTFVNLVTSDGDGTFTYTPTTDYSALHWAAKAATFNPALYYTQTEIDEFAQIWQNQATTITPSADSDYTLTAAENKYGRLILVDGSWLSGHNITVDNTERSFLVDNSAGTYTATVKTSAGSGISVQPGIIVELICDGVSVINSFNYFATLSTNFSGDLNNIKAQGNYAINSAATNLPATGYYSLSVFGNDTVLSQLATNRADGKTYIRAWNGTIWTSWVELGAGGKLLQVVNYTTGTLATGTAVIPLDNTIPQNTEGTQFMSLAITPLSAASKLKITVVADFANSLSAHITTALFRDSTANAVGSCFAVIQTANYGNSLSFVVFVDSGSTAATTFKVRMGPDATSTLTFNGRSAAQLLGGSIASSITIEEIVV
jgi:hypothetical protein